MDASVCAENTLSGIPSASKPSNPPYQPLDDTSRNIRLIRLRSGPRQQPQCDMSVFELADAPPFNALSYTWGPILPTYDIPVNDGTLPVRKGLCRFLQAFEGDEYLWIDQLCIDQSNVIERNHQVGLMSSIYSQCQSVIVWLGRLHTRPRALIIFNETHDVDALAILLQHEYFMRIWIVQEVLLAQTVNILCRHKEGNVWILWRDMCVVVGHSLTALQLLNVPSRALNLVRFHASPSEWSLTDAVTLFSGGYCQDVRDKVYGLIGIVQQQESIAVDYRKSAQEVLVEVAACFLREYNRIFGTAGLKETRDERLKRYKITVKTLSEIMRINDEERKGLGKLLYRVWPSGNTSEPFIATIPRMGFTPAVFSHETRPKNKGEPVSYARRLKSQRGYWWYEFQGVKHKFYCPPFGSTVRVVGYVYFSLMSKDRI